MTPELRAIAEDFRAAEARLGRLSAALPDGRWEERPGPGRWSVSECVEHLNLTGAVFLPVIRHALDEAARLEPARDSKLRRDFVGWLLARVMSPPVRFGRVKTGQRFKPGALEAPDALRAEFRRLQAEQLECVEEADGLPIDRVRVTSPFDGRVRYNLYSCLGILPRHQHRHLWQAEQVVDRLSAPAAG